MNGARQQLSLHGGSQRHDRGWHFRPLAHILCCTEQPHATSSGRANAPHDPRPAHLHSDLSPALLTTARPLHDSRLLYTLWGAPCPACCAIPPQHTPISFAHSAAWPVYHPHACSSPPAGTQTSRGARPCILKPFFQMPSSGQLALGSCLPSSAPLPAPRLIAYMPLSHPPGGQHSRPPPVPACRHCHQCGPACTTPTPPVLIPHFAFLLPFPHPPT